jgi:hypothetical protein
MTHATLDTRDGHARTVPAETRKRALADRHFPVGLVIAASAAVHVVAAALTYRTMVRELYTLFDATPRLLVLEHGLTRLTAASIFLPPVVPTALVMLVALWLGRAGRAAGATRWLALALVPLAIDSAIRAIGVSLAAAPTNIGELLDLPSRFSIGPRMLLDLAGIQPGAATGYWAVVCTIAAAISAWCVARAVLVAEAAAREGRGRRRRHGPDAIESLQVGVAVTGVWIAIAFAGEIALPFATQLFLRVFG